VLQTPPESWRGRRVRRAPCPHSEASEERTLESKKRASFSGEEVRQHDEVEAERIVGLGMKALGLTEESLREQLKGSVEKVALA